MSLVAAIKQRLLRLASVSTVYTGQDCAAAPLHAVVIEDLLDQKARKLVRWAWKFAAARDSFRSFCANGQR